MRKKKIITENPTQNIGFPEPMAESIAGKRMSFSQQDIELIKKRRAELIPRGLKDGRIATIVANENKWKVDSVISHMRRLRKKNEIIDNPNKVKIFDETEIKLIKRRWNELLAKGLRDMEISRVIAKENIWKPNSVYAVINRIRKNGAFGLNPNKKEKRGNLSEKDIESIEKERQDCIQRGMDDRQIIRGIAKKNGWKIGTIRTMVRRYIERGRFEPNPNGKEDYHRFSKNEITFMKKRRDELIRQGMQDRPITRIIAAETGWNSESVRDIISRLVINGSLEKNPNMRERRKPFSEKEILLIKRRWQELIFLGMKNRQIGEKIAQENGWKSGSIIDVVSNLIKNGELGVNPNKQRKKDKTTDEEIEFIKRRRQELIATGLNDTNITKEIAQEREWNFRSTLNFVYRLRKNGKLEDNPNRHHGLPRQSELMEGLRLAPEAMEKFGKEE